VTEEQDKREDMAALVKGLVPDHHYGGPVGVEVWGDLQEAGAWFIA